MLSSLIRRRKNPPLAESVPAAAPVEIPNEIHTLKENYPLTDAQYERGVSYVRSLQQLHDVAPAYIASAGLDPEIALPGNEWAKIVPAKGLRLRSSFADLNFLRLDAPFIGYHLPILDRRDRAQFATEEDFSFLDGLSQNGIPADIAAILAARLDMRRRLAPVVGEYETYVRGVPQKYRVGAPRMLGEIGVIIDGRVINPDILMCQSRINGMLSLGVIAKLGREIEERGRVRVLEIGPGYGALAYALRSIFGSKLEYILVDLPSSLYHSAVYLSTLLDGEACHLAMPGGAIPQHFNCLFVANYLLDEFAPRLGPIDLAINTMSFPEMSETQIRHYANLSARLLRPDGIFFDENGVYLPHHADSDAVLGSVFPFRKRLKSASVHIDRQCQNVWSKRYIGEIFDCDDLMIAMAVRGDREAAAPQTPIEPPPNGEPRALPR